MRPRRHPHTRRRALLAVTGLSLAALLHSVVQPVEDHQLPATAAAQPVTYGRSMWVWVRPDAHELVSFAASQRVRRLYIHVPPKVSRVDRAWLTQVRRHANRAGIALWALGGDPGWLTRPGDALAWQDAALDTGLFAGAHVDVEPHRLPAWSTTPRRQPQLAQAHVDLMHRMQDASALPLEADLPFWAGQVKLAGGTTWADAVLKRVDLVTAMSYRDTPAAVLEVGADMLRRGDSAGTPVQLAVETDPVPDCPKCTFAEEGAAAVHATLTVVERKARGHRSFAGVSVHRYTAWRDLTR